MESRPDTASVAIARALRGLVSWDCSDFRLESEPVERLATDPDVHLVATDRVHLDSEPLEAAWRAAGIAAEAVVFVSKHKAASGRPSLTVHPVGNYTEARFGGRPGRLSPAPAALQSQLLRALAVHVERDQYAAEVTFEVTHHGPLIETPACFLELGSSEAQWTDARGASVVARSLLDVLAAPLPSYPIVIGLGGGHYGPRFSEAVKTRAVHVAHMVPTHAAEAVTDPGAALAEVKERSPGANALYLHQGTLARPTLSRWEAAAAELGIPWAESRSWAPLESPNPPRTVP